MRKCLSLYLHILRLFNRIDIFNITNLKEFLFYEIKLCTEFEIVKVSEKKPVFVILFLWQKRF